MSNQPEELIRRWVLYLLEECPVVTIHRAVHIVGEQAVHSVPAHPGRQAQRLVRDGAHLEADARLLHALQEVRVPRQREPVPDASRPEEQRVQQVIVRGRPAGERLAAVEEERDLDARLVAVLLELEELGHEGVQGFALAFFAYEVKTYRIYVNGSPFMDFVLFYFFGWPTHQQSIVAISA